MKFVVMLIGLSYLKVLSYCGWGKDLLMKGVSEFVLWLSFYLSLIILWLSSLPPSFSRIWIGFCKSDLCVLCYFLDDLSFNVFVYRSSDWLFCILFSVSSLFNSNVCEPFLEIWFEFELILFMGTSKFVKTFDTSSDGWFS